MTHFVIKKLPLPDWGEIPGARGYKKVVIPKGTEVYCIMHGFSKYFWACYLHEEEAVKAAQGLEDCISGRSKRKIDLQTLLAWNFKTVFPTRVHRPKAKPVELERVGDN